MCRLELNRLKFKSDEAPKKVLVLYDRSHLAFLRSGRDDLVIQPYIRWHPFPTTHTFFVTVKEAAV